MIDVSLNSGSNRYDFPAIIKKDNEELVYITAEEIKNIIFKLNAIVRIDITRKLQKELLGDLSKELIGFDKEDSKTKKNIK